MDLGLTADMTFTVTQVASGKLRPFNIQIRHAFILITVHELVCFRFAKSVCVEDWIRFIGRGWHKK